MSSPSPTPSSGLPGLPPIPEMYLHGKDDFKMDREREQAKRDQEDADALRKAEEMDNKFADSLVFAYKSPERKAAEVLNEMSKSPPLDSTTSKKLADLFKKLGIDNPPELAITKKPPPSGEIEDFIKDFSSC